MRPGKARTSGLGAPLLLLARRVGLVTPVRPPLRLWFFVPCPSAAPGAYARAVSGTSWRLFTSVPVPCVLCTVSVATWRLFTGVHVVCGMRVVFAASSPPLFWVFGFFDFCLKRERKWCRTRERYRHRREPLQQRCSSAVFLVLMCVAGIFLAVAPQGCRSRVIMYTGVGYCGSRWVSLCFWVKPRLGPVGVASGSGGSCGLGGFDDFGRASRLRFCFIWLGEAWRVRRCRRW